MNLNRNCIVIQDSDRTGKDKELNKMKIWVKRKCKALGIYCWTTERREIENYFSKNAIVKYGKNHRRKLVKDPINFDHYVSIDQIIPTYSDDKPGNAKEIVSYMTKEEIMCQRELISELEEIKRLIHNWNK